MPAPMAWGCHGPTNTQLLALLRDYATQKIWPWNREGGWEDKNGDQRRGKQPPGQPGPAEQGSAEQSRKDSPVRRESKGTRSVVQGKGEGRGGKRGETGTARIKCLRPWRRVVTDPPKHSYLPS